MSDSDTIDEPHPVATSRRPKFDNLDTKVARLMLRRDTIERFVPLIYVINRKDGTKLTVEIQKGDLTKRATELAKRIGITQQHLTTLWSDHCERIYGESRRWPGPMTETNHKYGHRVQTKYSSYTQLQQEARRQIQRKARLRRLGVLDDGDDTDVDGPTKTMVPSGGL